MGWFKVDDQLAFNAKVVVAGNAAMGLWVRAGSWSSAQLTGGFIAKPMANAMANECDADALVMAGLWHEVEGGFQFHDWDEFQPDAVTEKEKRKATSEARSAAGRAGAAARWNGKTDGKRNGKPIANRWQNDAPDPTRPITEEGKPSSSSSDAKAPDTRAPEFPDHVHQLCDHLANKIRTNGNKVGTVGTTWHLAMDRLGRIDGYTPDQIRQVIDWSQQDEFWQGNILSAGKLREKFDQLKTRMLNQRQAPGKQTPMGRVEQTAQLGHALQAQYDQQQLGIDP